MEEQTVRIPVLAQLHEHARCRDGIDARHYYRNASVLVGSQVACTRAYGMDDCMVLYDVYNLEAQAVGQPVVFPRTGVPQLARSRLLGPGSPARDVALNPASTSCAEPARFVNEVNRLVRRETGAPPALLFTAPFSLAVQLRGYTPFVTDLKRDFPLAMHLLEMLAERVLVPWIRLLHDNCPDSPAAMGADAWGSLPNTDLETWDSSIIPIYRHLRDLLAEEIPVGFTGYWGESLTGDPRGFVQRKIAVSGPCFGGGIMALDPDVQRLGADFFARLARELARPLILGIDAEILRTGRAPAVAGRVQDYVASGRRRQVPLSILLADVSGDTPPENVRAAVEAAHHPAGP